MSTKSALAATLAASTIIISLASAPQAEAARPNQCATIRSTNVGGFNWRTLPTTRICSNTLKQGVSGQAHLTKKQVVIHYSAQRSSKLEVTKATVHEMAHQVEYRTTPAHRARLYAYMGQKNPTGNYFAINDAYYYSGPLALWKQSPRERLAESVVNCKLGSPNHSGMALVPRAKCTPFLNEFKASLAAAR